MVSDKCRYMVKICSNELSKKKRFPKFYYYEGSALVLFNF
jgi:hypothetical protein